MLLVWQPKSTAVATSFEPYMLFDTDTPFIENRSHKWLDKNFLQVGLTDKNRIAAIDRIISGYVDMC